MRSISTHINLTIICALFLSPVRKYRRWMTNENNLDGNAGMGSSDLFSVLDKFSMNGRTKALQKYQKNISPLLNKQSYGNFICFTCLERPCLKYIVSMYYSDKLMLIRRKSLLEIGNFCRFKYSGLLISNWIFCLAFLNKRGLEGQKIGKNQIQFIFDL